MGRNRRMDYELIAGLYENNYSTVIIGRILATPNGHVSKVLFKQGVEARKRGVRVKPVAFELLSKDLQDNIMYDEKLFEGYQRVMGEVNVPKKEDVAEVAEVKDWKEMSLEEKGKRIVELLDNGLSTRKAAAEIGISQSTLVKTKNRYLYGTDTVPKKLA